MTPKRQRLLFALFGVAMLVASSLLILNRFSEHLVFFYSPTDIQANPPLASQHIRLGGLVEDGSLEQDGQHYRFTVTDLMSRVTVEYDGLPPSLFREGQGVIAEGVYDGAVFKAVRLLAKHDENYMPPEVAKALKESGRWKAPAREKPQPNILPELAP